MTSNEPSGAGLFGKVPTLGDFVTRRLPSSFTDALDQWLQSGIAHGREVMADQWLDLYLTSPVWRFALQAGVCDQQSWIGVLMPSVDKVGRYFPLSIATSHPGKLTATECMSVYSDWYDQATTLALTCLSDDFVFDELDRSLQDLRLPEIDRESSVNGRPLNSIASSGLRFDLPEAELLPDAQPQIISNLLNELFSAHSVWWAGGSQTMQPSLLICQGLPSQRNFSAMLSGQWDANGWTDYGQRQAVPQQEDATANEQ